MKIPEIKETFLNIFYSDHLHYLIESYEENEKVIQGTWKIFSFGQPLGMTDFYVSRNQVGGILFEIGKYKIEDYYHTFIINSDNLFYENYKKLMGKKESFTIWQDPKSREKGLQIKKEEKSYTIQFVGFEENEEHKIFLNPFYQNTNEEKKLMEILDDFLKGLNNTVKHYYSVIEPRERIKRITPHR